MALDALHALAADPGLGLLKLRPYVGAVVDHAVSFSSGA